MHGNQFSARAAPRTPLGQLTTLRQTHLSAWERGHPSPFPSSSTPSASQSRCLWHLTSDPQFSLRLTPTVGTCTSTVLKYWLCVYTCTSSLRTWYKCANCRIIYTGLRICFKHHNPTVSTFPNNRVERVEQKRKDFKVRVNIQSVLQRLQSLPQPRSKTQDYVITHIKT